MLCALQLGYREPAGLQILGCLGRIFEIETVGLLDVEDPLVEIGCFRAEEVGGDGIKIEPSGPLPPAEDGHFTPVAAGNDQGAVGGDDKLDFRKTAGEQPEDLLLPAGMKVRVDLVDENKTGCAK